MATDYSLLKVYTESNDLAVTFRFYQAVPNVSGGGGGWQAVQRPLDAPVIAWRGATDLYTMELQLIMDKFAAPLNADGSEPDVEADCRQLEQMYGALVSPVHQPPLLILDANGALQNDVYNNPSIRWVIPEPPTWQDVDRNSKGRRVRQVVTVKFMHFLAYDQLTRNTDVSQHAPRNTFTSTSSVNTFRKAAAKYLKSYGGARWATRLANLNGARDPTAPLLPGRVFKLPTAAQIKQWEQTARR